MKQLAALFFMDQRHALRLSLLVLFCCMIPDGQAADSMHEQIDAYTIVGAPNAPHTLRIYWSPLCLHCIEFFAPSRQTDDARKIMMAIESGIKSGALKVELLELFWLSSKPPSKTAEGLLAAYESEERSRKVAAIAACTAKDKNSMDSYQNVLDQLAKRLKSTDDGVLFDATKKSEFDTYVKMVTTNSFSEHICIMNMETKLKQRHTQAREKNIFMNAVLPFMILDNKERSPIDTIDANRFVKYMDRIVKDSNGG